MKNSLETKIIVKNLSRKRINKLFLRIILVDISTNSLCSMLTLLHIHIMEVSIKYKF